MNYLKINFTEKKTIKGKQKKGRKPERDEIYKLWQEELEEKGFKKFTRLQQGLL